MTQDETWLLAEKYDGQKTEGFLADCTRLQKGEPLAYLIGTIPFLDTTIHLGSRPLIPRVETEYWVEKMLTEIDARHMAKALNILDLCAGSGCIGVALLKHVPECTVDFGEIDAAHHPIIRKNILENNIDMSRARIFGGDLMSEITGTYDYIFTNPPYIDTSDDHSTGSVRTYEPHLALYGGAGGLDIISRIIEEAPQHLRSGGTLIIEHEPSQSVHIEVQALKQGFSATTCTDQYGHERYTVLVRANETLVAQ